jgi:ribosome biogenesis GTPase
VVGDRVLWVEAKGEGGKLTQVLPRSTVLARRDHKGQEQVIAANLTGVLICDTPTSPPLAPSILDRYVVAATTGGLRPMIVVNKCDLGEPADVVGELTARETAGILVFRVSAHTGTGIAELRSALEHGTWAVVGRSGVGKTSLVAALVPGAAVGPVGALSEYWGMGTHTTTRSCWFDLVNGGALVDSPGIRSFSPAGIDEESLRAHFPGLTELQCQYRDCLHRDGEEGCRAPDRLPPPLLQSYRTLLEEVSQIDAGIRRGRGEREKKRS